MDKKNVHWISELEAKIKELKKELLKNKTETAKGKNKENLQESKKAKQENTKEAKKSHKEKKEIKKQENTKEANQEKEGKKSIIDLVEKSYLNEISRQHSPDYESAFSYLGSGVAVQSYSYSSESEKSFAVMHEESAVIPWKKIRSFTEEWRMDAVAGRQRYGEISDDRFAYRLWKMFNSGLANILYETVMT